MIVLEYETNIEESIDLQIRNHWLQKSSKRSLFVNAIIVPLVVVFLIFPNLRTGNHLITNSVFLVFWTFYLIYAYGPGYRRKMRKFILNTLDGKPFPTTFKCTIDDSGILNETIMAQIKYPWSSVKKIQYHKESVEIQATGFLTWLDKEHAPDISVLNELWEKNR